MNRLERVASTFTLQRTPSMPRIYGFLEAELALD